MPEVANSPKITYIIAYKHNPERLKNLRRILEWLLPFQGLEILIVEQDKNYSKISELNLRAKHVFLKNDTGLFNKSWAYNYGCLISNTPILIFGDCDLIMNPNDFVNAIQLMNKYDCINPYSSVIDLTPQESMMDINSILSINRIGRGDAIDDIQKCPMMGGIFIIKKDAFLKMGGSNEDFIEWGAEDTFLDIKVKNFLTYYEVPNVKCFHLYHEKAQINQKLYERNLNILNHFAKATKEQLQNHINMVSGKIGKKNKYN